MLVRLTEAETNKQYKVFTMDMPERILQYYMNSGIFHGAIITLLSPFDDTSVRVDTGEYRYSIANHLAKNIIVEEVNKE
jgi:Fe2+ transport system protein FeoA